MTRVRVAALAALPVDAAESHMGMAFAKWYASKGTAG